MKLRFPHDKKGQGYYEEWERRLNTGDPRGLMDSKTLKIFKKVKKEFGIP
jgi:hypothetical protein